MQRREAFGTPASVRGKLDGAGFEDTSRTARAQECLDRGLILAMFGEVTEATRFYRKSVLLDPDNALGHYMLGMSLMNADAIDEAREEWLAATQTNRCGSQAEWARRQAGKLLKGLTGD
jgi:hypothetical protein